MSHAVPPVKETQWILHKAFIRRRYLAEDVPLKTLVKELAERGLVAT